MGGATTKGAGSRSLMRLDCGDFETHSCAIVCPGCRAIVGRLVPPSLSEECRSRTSSPFIDMRRVSAGRVCQIKVPIISWRSNPTRTTTVRSIRIMRAQLRMSKHYREELHELRDR